MDIAVDLPAYGGDAEEDTISAAAEVEIEEVYAAEDAVASELVEGLGGPAEEEEEEYGRSEATKVTISPSERICSWRSCIQLHRPFCERIFTCPGHHGGTFSKGAKRNSEHEQSFDCC